MDSSWTSNLQNISNWSSILGFILSVFLILIGISINHKIKTIKNEIWISTNLKTIRKKLKENIQNLNGMTDSDVWNVIEIKKELSITTSNFEDIVSKLSKEDKNIKSKIKKFNKRGECFTKNTLIDKKELLSLIFELHGIKTNIDNIILDIKYR